jgi:hypothetical protein
MEEEKHLLPCQRPDAFAGSKPTYGAIPVQLSINPQQKARVDRMNDRSPNDDRRHFHSFDLRLR